VWYSLDRLRLEENSEIVRPCEDDDGELAWPSEENVGDLRVPRVEEDKIRLEFAWQILRKSAWSFGRKSRERKSVFVTGQLWNP
jgi:hypothetical protein